MPSEKLDILKRVSDAIVAVDELWRYTYLNDAALATHPDGREGTLGRSIWEVHPDMLGTIFEEKYRNAMSSGVSDEVESYYEPMDAWFVAKIYPDSEGLTIIYKDITRSKKAERELTAKQQQLQLIYDTVSDPIFLLEVLPEEKYKIISVNNAFCTTTGLGSEMLMNKLINDIIPEPSLQIVLTNYKKAIETRKNVQWEEITPYPTGVKTGIITLSPILDKENNCVQLLGVVHDITERKNAEQSMQVMNEQLRNLSGHLQNIREEERSRVAREIHDDFGQQLTGLKFVLTALKNKNTKEYHIDALEEQIYEMIYLVDSAIVSVRKIARELRPGVLDDLGLEAAIEWQGKEFEERTSIKTTIVSELGSELFPKEVNTTVFRIFQESLTNIIRHSKATEIWVKLFTTPDDLILEVIDNGVGISEERKNNISSLGLLGMKERAIYVNGTFSIDKHQNGGTIVTVKIPVKS